MCDVCECRVEVLGECVENMGVGVDGRCLLFVFDIEDGFLRMGYGVGRDCDVGYFCDRVYED